MSRLFWLCRFGRRLTSLRGVNRSVTVPAYCRFVRCFSSSVSSQMSTSSWLKSFHPHTTPMTTRFLRGLSSSLPTDGAELEMPALSPTMEKGGIASWLKKEGDKVTPGDAIAEIETDKATLEWELTDGGYIAKILYQAGEKDIPVGTCVAILVDEEKDIAAYKDYTHDPSASVAAAAAASTSAAPTKQQEPSAEPPSASQTSALKDYPAHIVVDFPALSPTMERGSIGTWVKTEGDYVSSGETICTIVTDKATNDFECLDEGYIAKILVPDGAEDLAVGIPIAVLVDEKDSVPDFQNFTADDAVNKPTEAAKAEVTAPPEDTQIAQPPASTPPMATTPSPSDGTRIAASPFAKKLASEANIELGGITGSGPGGRIIAADVHSLMNRGVAVTSSKPIEQTEGPFSDLPLSQIRRVIAERLTESKQTIPHYYLTVDCNVDELIDLRKKLNAKLEKEGTGVKLSINDFIIKAAALALKRVPEVNSSWQGDFIRQYNAAHVSVAVQTDGGLMVPVVKNADVIGLQSISNEVKSLAEKAKNGKLRPEEYTGGTFTISNLGMFGIKQFCAIVNPPQAAILAVGGTQPRLFKDANDGEIQQKTFMSCTLSCDHRVVDGAVGAMWLKEFRNYLEQPLMMLL